MAIRSLGLRFLSKKLGAVLGTKMEQTEMTVPDIQPPLERLALEEASTADLVREALDEARELVRIEVELAKGEVEREIQQAKRAAIGFGVAAAAATVALSMFAVAIVLALGATPVASLLVGGMFAVVAGVAGFLAYTTIPRKPLERTRHRLKADMNQLKEHIA